MTETQVEANDPAPDDLTRSGRVRVLDRNPRLAVAIFVVVEAAALVLYLWFGRKQWFFLDEWDFLAGRHITNIDDLLRPHNEHWTALPIVVYRGLWNAVGLRVYWPYQLLAIGNHLVVAALLRVVMRRAGVGPWIATVCAGAFVLFGSGNQDILWAFQFVFAVPLTFGLVHMLLADHDGPISRRDWFGLLAGLAAITSSGLGVTMVVAVGIAVLVRRGWRMALFHTVPLAMIYGIWWLAYGRDAQAARLMPDLIIRFMSKGFSATFEALGMVPYVGLLLAVAMVGGLGLAWYRVRGREVRVRAAMPFALLIGSLTFLTIAGWGRAGFGVEFAGRSRYIHVAAALVLPAVAVAVDALYRRWAVVGVAAGIALLVGVPGNIRETVRYTENNPLALGQPDLILFMPHSDIATQVPRDVHPFPDAAKEVTIGWLLDAAESGKAPAPSQPASPALEAIGRLRLGLRQSDDPPAGESCRALTEPTDRTLAEGESFSFDGGQLSVAGLDPALPRTYFMRFTPSDGERLTAVRGPMELRLMSSNAFIPVSICA